VNFQKKKLPKISHFLNPRKSSVVQSIGIYTFTNFVGKGASFLLLFLYTNPIYINPAENGLLSLLNTSSIFLMPFVSMGVLHSVSTDFFKMNDKTFRDFFTTTFLLPLIISLCSFVGLFFLRDYLKATYGFPLMFVWVIPAIVFLTFCFEHLINLIRNNNEPTRFMQVNFAKTFLEIAVSVLLVVFLAWRWEGRVAGILIAYLVLGAYAFYYFYRKGYLFGAFRAEYIYKELIYAVPIIAMQASMFAMNASDKFFLSLATSDNNETVGIYSIACVFASVINILCLAILQYLFPKIYTTLSAARIDYSSIKKHFYFFAGIMTAGTLAVMAFTPLLYKYFINHKYLPALQYIYFLCIGYFLWAFTYYFYSFLLFYKHKRKILLLSICNIAISFGCNYYFINKWEAMGAAVSIMISYFISLLITLIVVRSYIIKIFFTKHAVV
jgi:O-antigen/teichoic acid export membrane protein